MWNLLALRSTRVPGEFTRCLSLRGTKTLSSEKEAKKLQKSPAVKPPVVVTDLEKRTEIPAITESVPTSFKIALDQSELNTARRSDEAAEKFLLGASRQVEKEDKPTQVNWNAATKVIKEAERRFPLRYYEAAELEDVQEKCITYNLAKVINESPTLKKLVDLGVELYKWEEKDSRIRPNQKGTENLNWTDIALRLDFDTHVAPKVRLLADYVHADMIGYIFTKNAPLLLEDMDHLQTRVKYLCSKKFTGAMIKSVLCENPYWLTYTVDEIDARLGYFQKTFSLSGSELRGLAVKLPKLITWGGAPGQVRTNLLVLKEQCGFKDSEIKTMILDFPLLLYQTHELVIHDMFQFLHNEVGYSHRQLRHVPEVLVCDALETKPRHDFLKAVDRACYDPIKPLYVSPGKLVLMDDSEFCSKVAGVSVNLYNEFLKTV